MSKLYRTADILWRDYAFLTQEILKFTQKKEFDMVLELLSQRENLQLLLEQTSDKSFLDSASGRELLKKLQNQNLIIEDTLKHIYNNAKRIQQVSNSYDGLGTEIAGSLMDRKS